MLIQRNEQILHFLILICFSKQEQSVSWSPTDQLKVSASEHLLFRYKTLRQG